MQRNSSDRNIGLGSKEAPLSLLIGHFGSNAPVQAVRVLVPPGILQKRSLPSSEDVSHFQPFTENNNPQPVSVNYGENMPCLFSYFRPQVLQPTETYRQPTVRGRLETFDCFGCGQSQTVVSGSGILVIRAHV